MWKYLTRSEKYLHTAHSNVLPARLHNSGATINIIQIIPIIQIKGVKWSTVIRVRAWFWRSTAKWKSKPDSNIIPPYVIDETKKKQWAWVFAEFRISQSIPESGQKSAFRLGPSRILKILSVTCSWSALCSQCSPLISIDTALPAWFFFLPPSSLSLGDSAVPVPVPVLVFFALFPILLFIILYCCGGFAERPSVQKKLNAPQTEI